MEDHCKGLESDLELAVNTLEKLRNDYLDTKFELDRFRNHYREGNNEESTSMLYDPSDENFRSQNPWSSND